MKHQLSSETWAEGNLALAYDPTLSEKQPELILLATPTEDTITFDPSKEVVTDDVPHISLPKVEEGPLVTGDERIYTLLRSLPHLLTPRQVFIAMNTMQKGQSLKELQKNYCFWSEVSDARERLLLQNAFYESSDIKQLLLLSNLRLIASWARKVHAHYQSGNFEDLFQEGYFGMAVAIEKVDISKAKLSTYASFWIQQAMQRVVSNMNRYIHIPVNIHTSLSQVRRAISSFTITHERKPDIDELTEELKMYTICQYTPAEVQGLLDILESPVSNAAQSLDAMLHTDDSEVVLSDTLSDDDPTAPQVYEQQELHDRLYELLQKYCNPTELKIMLNKHGLNEAHQKMTFVQIGAILGCTKQNVQVKEMNARKKLRKACMEDPAFLDLADIL